MEKPAGPVIFRIAFSTIFPPVSTIMSKRIALPALAVGGDLILMLKLSAADPMAEDRIRNVSTAVITMGREGRM